jgi:Peptidase family M1 domain
MPRLLIVLFSSISFYLTAQDYRWQQRVEYTMNVRLDTKTHKVSGDQRLVYFNNSPDTLYKVYYHLYFNAFQPGSMMDVRSRNIKDPDARIADRISKLKEDGIGFQRILSLKQDGKDLSHQVSGTVLEVILAHPILPQTKTIFDMKFESQVPIQIRRSGRDNREGIAYSMTQWYPKMAEYDFQGWHAYQYVAREFHSVWSDFDVKITLDANYVISGTGKLQNAQAIGHGYETPGSKVNTSGKELTWHFIAKNVIDFAWAADPDYAHDRLQVPDGPELHFFYKKTEKVAENWKKMEPGAVRFFQFMNKTFGKYPFDTYSIIQGGDGGMEYPMCTLIMGEGSPSALMSVMAHEVAHSWYQMVLASNESLYAWLDEGFTDFASSEAETFLFGDPNPHRNNYQGYFSLVASGLQEPMNQHADHFSTNRSYSVSAYSMGAIFVNQLKYLIGEETFYKGMRRYYNTWKFRHPEPNDFIRVMEKTSGLQLHWYLRYWINTTKRIDYGISNIIDSEGGANILLQRIGEFPMPIDLVITYKDGTKEFYYIPMNELMGKKPVVATNGKRDDVNEWAWVNPSYTLKINRKANDIEVIEIDPSQRMADVNRKNNKVIISDNTVPDNNK